jgi:hypothetical protein
MMPFEQVIIQGKIAQEKLRATFEEQVPERSAKTSLLLCCATWNGHLPKIWKSFEAIGRIASKTRTDRYGAVQDYVHEIEQHLTDVKAKLEECSMFAPNE